MKKELAPCAEYVRLVDIHFRTSTTNYSSHTPTSCFGTHITERTYSISTTPSPQKYQLSHINCCQVGGPPPCDKYTFWKHGRDMLMYLAMLGVIIAAFLGLLQPDQLFEVLKQLAQSVRAFAAYSLL